MASEEGEQVVKTSSYPPQSSLRGPSRKTMEITSRFPSQDLSPWADCKQQKHESLYCATDLATCCSSSGAHILSYTTFLAVDIIACMGVL